MRQLKVVVIIAIASLLLSLGTFAFKRIDYSGCNPPNNPQAGATSCQTYGPAEDQGWPLKRKVIPGYRNGLSQEERISLSGDYNRELTFVIIGNLIFYIAMTSLFSWLLVTIRKRNAHTRH